MIYDNTGKSVFKHKFNAKDSYAIDLSFLKPGFYVLAIEANGKRYSKPIIKAL